jgi:hypothetical protein
MHQTEVLPLRTDLIENYNPQQNRRFAYRQTPYFCPATKVSKSAFAGSGMWSRFATKVY